MVEINFFQAADWVENHKCDERRMYGSCHHKGCRKTQEIVDNLLDRAMGRPLSNDLTLEQIADWASRKSCADMRQSGFRGCSRHRWYNESGPYILWLMEQARLEKQQKRQLKHVLCNARSDRQQNKPPGVCPRR